VSVTHIYLYTKTFAKSKGPPYRKTVFLDFLDDLSAKRAESITK
jgi:hypothetical protein